MSKLLSLYFQKDSIGISLYDPKGNRIKCSSLFHTCYISSSFLVPLLQQSSTLLTNNRFHPILARLDLSSLNILHIDESYHRYQTIEQNLQLISSHLSKLKNKKEYFMKMNENRIKFNALGVLLKYILLQGYSKVYLQEIQYFNDTLLELLIYGRNELQFLQIIKEDIHPSLIKGKGQSKQGYSILSAYQSYIFSHGSKVVLRFIIFNPIYKREILQERYNLVQWMKLEMGDAAKYSKSFKQVHSLDTVVGKFGKMKAEEQDWKKLLRTMQTMIQIAGQLRLIYELGRGREKEKLPRLIQEYIEDPNWGQLIQINSLFKQTFQFNPFRIRNGIDSTLDSLRKTYDSMPHLLTLIAKEQEWDIQFRIVFITQIGFLVRLGKEVELGGFGQDWILQFQNNTGRYYSNQLTVRLDLEYGDTFGEMQDIQKKLTFDLQALVVQREGFILDIYWKLCQIQCFWGVSQLSRNMCRPKLSSQALVVSNGWHMLLSGQAIRNHSFSFGQKQAPRRQSTFCRIIVFNSEGNIANTNYSNRCVIVTGPNAAGKTVYMKQVGVIVYLTHLGFFVPSAFAEIPLIDSIKFVGKSASLYGSHCGFHSELASLSSLTQPYTITNKTFIIIDQLGSQIDYQSSLKLIYATVNFLSASSFPHHPILTHRNDEFSTPIVLIVTHLSQILNGKILVENYLVRFLTMAIEEKGKNLFKIRPGLAAKGYGFRVAEGIMTEKFIEVSRLYMEYIEKN